MDVYCLYTVSVQILNWCSIQTGGLCSPRHFCPKSKLDYVNRFINFFENCPAWCWNLNWRLFGLQHNWEFGCSEFGNPLYKELPQIRMNVEFISPNFSRVKRIQKEEEFSDCGANVEWVEGLVQPVQLRQRLDQLWDVVLHILLTKKPFWKK